MEPNVSFTRAEYINMSEYWDIMEDTTTSEKHMHDMSDKYIHRLEGMTDTEYSDYVDRGAFPLFTKHAHTNFVGMALRKPVMTKGIPKSFSLNIDGTGRTLDQYIKMLLDGFLLYGRALTLIDYANAQGRPKMLYYSARSIINWDTRIINDVEVLSLVVLKESYNERIDMFKMDTKTRYRVLYLEEGTNIYTQALYDHKGKLISKTSPTRSHRHLKFIPATIHGGISPSLPPLLQIAEQNIHYYKLDVSYKHGLHFVALPTPWTVGVSTADRDRSNKLGPTVVWRLPDDGSCGMLEFSGEGLGEFNEAKRECLDNIITLSSQILAPPKNMNETATAASIRNAGETASLAELVDMLSKDITGLCRKALEWGGDSDYSDVDVIINNDFVPTILSGADVASYIAATVKGGLSPKTRHGLLKRGEIVDGDVSFEEEQRQIDEARLKEIKFKVLEAKLIAEAEAKAISKTNAESQQDGDTIRDGKQTEQFNKGQDYREN